MRSWCLPAIANDRCRVSTRATIAKFGSAVAKFAGQCGFGGYSTLAIAVPGYSGRESEKLVYRN